jgi:hypothetical protein
MIAYCGDFGSGKTAHMVSDLEKYASPSTYIISNFTLSFASANIYEMNEFVEFLEFIFWEKRNKSNVLKGKRIFISIDEAQIWFNARNFKTFPPGLLDFICQLRKLDSEIFFTVQRPSMIDKNFRTFVDTWQNYERPLYAFDRYDTDGIKKPRWFNRWGSVRYYDLGDEATSIYNAVQIKHKFTWLSDRPHLYYDSTEMVTKTPPEGKCKPAEWRDMFLRPAPLPSFIRKCTQSSGENIIAETQDSMSRPGSGLVANTRKNILQGKQATPGASPFVLRPLRS